MRFMKKMLLIIGIGICSKMYGEKGRRELCLLGGFEDFGELKWGKG